MSAAEKQRRYGARRDADPERREKYLVEEKEKYKRDLQSGKRKNISQVSAREQRQQRRKWRETYYRLKEGKRPLQGLLATPPHSPDPSRLKGPPAIWQHLSPVLDDVRSTYPEITTVHFYSDGSCTQYRQRGNLFLVSTELFSCGFKAGTWNYFEASHGKGAPDGIGGALKRKADSIVCRGTDIPGAAELYSALQKSGTSVKLFFVDEQDIDRAVQGMPNDLPPLPSTMKMHQAVTLAYGEVSYRDVSCMCTAAQNLHCECFDAKHFTFTHSQAVPTASTDITELQRPEAVGQWCILKYDGDLYPGVITDMSETHVEVRSMAKVGVNRFFWPARDSVVPVR